MPLPVRQFQAIELINPAKGAAGLDLTLELDPARRRRCGLVDPDGRPLTGVKVKEFIGRVVVGAAAGVGAGGVRDRPRAGARAAPAARRRKLAAAVEVKPDSPSPLTVTLKPWRR